MNVLIVNHASSLLEEFSELLARMGHSSETAETLGLATDALVKDTFDALVLGVQCGARAALDWFEASDVADSVPTLLLSRDSDFDEVLRGLALGAKDVVRDDDPIEHIVVCLEDVARAGRTGHGARGLRRTAVMETVHSTREVLDLVHAGKLRRAIEIRHLGKIHVVFEEAVAPSPLSTREATMLAQFAQGDNLRLVADKHELSVSQTWTILEKQRAKLGFRDRFQFQRFLARCHLDLHVKAAKTVNYSQGTPP